MENYRRKTITTFVTLQYTSVIKRNQNRIFFEAFVVAGGMSLPAHLSSSFCVRLCVLCPLSVDAVCNLAIRYCVCIHVHALESSIISVSVLFSWTPECKNGLC